MHDGERFNAWTHLVGALLALSGAVWLIVVAVSGGDPWKIVGVSVYGATLVALYCISTLYHSVSGAAKEVMRTLDHLSIYLLIAGSYTPFCLVTLRGPWGWSLFGVVWALAVIGIWHDLRRRPGPRVLSVVIYAVMGWCVLVAIGPLLDALGRSGFSLLVAGGAVYTLGIVSFAYGRYFPFWHGVWHLLVMAGSLLHYFAILFYVV